MKDVNHLFDTQVIEAINEMITQYAPKNRFYSRTNSLEARILFSIGVNIINPTNIVGE